jgi:hypothetical protein
MACRRANWILVLISLGILFSCKSKKISLADNEDVDIRDFIEFFQQVSLPFQFSDTMLVKHHNDSAAIGFQTLLRFVPDTVISKAFGKLVHPKLYPVGKAGGGKIETYIFIKAITAAKRVLYVFCFNKEDKFSAAKALITLEGDAKSNTVFTMDSKYTMTILRQRKSEGQVLYRKEAYVYNDAGLFNLILTESNEAKPSAAMVYNPIDTLSRKHKFSGDYFQDKRNLVSVRDAKDNSKFLFFIHFEKEEGACKGELKGEGKMVSATIARFRSNADPCLIEFSFTTASVRIKELEGCGNHRDIKCNFEGVFEKKKEIKSKNQKKK